MSERETRSQEFVRLLAEYEERKASGREAVTRYAEERLKEYLFENKEFLRDALLEYVRIK
jgi:hypothetical protein